MGAATAALVVEAATEVVDVACHTAYLCNILAMWEISTVKEHNSNFTTPAGCYTSNCTLNALH